MGVNHLGPGSQRQEYQRLWTAIRAVAKATLQNGSIGRGGLRVYGGGFITIENGGLDVTGVAEVTGLLTGSGDFDWYGTSRFYGPVNVGGNMATSGNLLVVGTTQLDGPVTMNNDLTLGSGRIVAGSLVIDRVGGFNGRIAASAALVFDAGTAVLIRANTDIRGNLLTDGLDVDGPKNFRIAHPTKPGYYLRHGSTESPVSGIEYWGDEVLDGSGKFVVELPEYFEKLAKPEGRVPFVTGRGFSADWGDIEDGKFTVTGKPGGRFSWQVKAERFGGDFLLEEEIPIEEEPTEEAPDALA